MAPWVDEGGSRVMPRICNFYGIAIFMYFMDHAPPHFHAIYGEHEAAIRIDDQEPLAGFLPVKASALVREWATIHQAELRANWGRAQAGEPLEQIAPLP